MYDLGMVGKPIDSLNNAIVVDPTDNTLSIEIGLIELDSAVI